ncbi:MAG: LPP20 family lipoprotein [Thiovulaceae bacterium]|nr:LPP20 family lipoprotein [Sulfurimonadaceae bacterium]
MKYSLVLATLLMSASVYANDVQCTKGVDANRTTTCIKAPVDPNDVIRDNVLVNEVSPTHEIRISVVGEGVSPLSTSSPAQAYALAKRAAIADGYRQIAEKVKGVRVEGQDTINNMMMQRSTVRTSVDATIRNANVVETSFKEGLCEVEMEIVLSYAQFAR